MMRNENSLFDRLSPVTEDVTDKQARNRDYHIGRARHERTVAAASGDPAARSLHLQLADLHDAAARVAAAAAA